MPTARQVSFEEADQSQAIAVMASGAAVGVMKRTQSSCSDDGEVVERRRTRRWPRAMAISTLHARRLREINGMGIFHKNMNIALRGDSPSGMHAVNELFVLRCFY